MEITKMHYSFESVSGYFSRIRFSFVGSDPDPALVCKIGSKMPVRLLIKNKEKDFFLNFNNFRVDFLSLDIEGTEFQVRRKKKQ